MKIVNIVRSAFRALRRNKMRSFLTMLGIIIGVGAVIAMLAIGQGAEYSVKQQISSLGTNVLIVFPGSQQTGGLRMGAGTVTTLTEEDAWAIQKECPAGKDNAEKPTRQPPLQPHDGFGHRVYCQYVRMNSAANEAHKRFHLR